MIPAVFLQVAAQNVFKCSTRWVFRVCDWSSKRLISLLLLIVTAFLNRRRLNSFVMITANRVLHCNADTPEEMHHWITLLQRSKGDTRVDGQEFIIRGERCDHFNQSQCAFRQENRSDLQQQSNNTQMWTMSEEHVQLYRGSWWRLDLKTAEKVEESSLM